MLRNRVTGTVQKWNIAIAPLANGRSRCKFPIQDNAPSGLTVQPDGTTIYWAVDGRWAVPFEGGEPRKIHAGDSVDADPSGSVFITDFNESVRIRFVTTSPEGGTEQALTFTGALRVPWAGTGSRCRRPGPSHPVFWPSARSLVSDPWDNRPTNHTITRMPLDYLKFWFAGPTEKKDHPLRHVQLKK